MSIRSIVKNSTDQSVVIRIIDSTAGTPETGVEHDSGGIDLWYRREGATKTSITEAALAALDSAHSDGGIEHIGDGYYRLDLPDAAVATGCNGVMVGGTVTGMIVIGCYVPLVDVNPYDSVRMGMTALPNAAADAAGGLMISDDGGWDADELYDAIITDAAGANIAADIIALKAETVEIVTDTGTTLDTLIKDIPTTAEFEARTLLAADYTVVADLGTVQSGDSFAIVNGDHGLVSIQDDIDDILTDTGTTLDTLIKDIPTVAEFEARTLVAADYVVVGDTIAGATVVGSVSGNVDGDVSGNVDGTVAGVTPEAAGVAPTAEEIKTAMEAEGTSDLDAIADAVAHATYGLSALKTLIDAIGGDATAANQTTIINHLTDVKGGTFAGATDSLEAIRNRGDAAWVTGGTGSGAIEWVYTLTDSGTGNPIADCLIWVTTDLAGTNTVASGRTNDFGIATFYLDAATYYFWRKKAGYNFTNPDTEVVA